MERFKERRKGGWWSGGVVVLSYPVSVLTSLSDQGFLLPFAVFLFVLHSGHFHLLRAINRIKKEMTCNDIDFVFMSQ